MNYSVESLFQVSTRALIKQIEKGRLPSHDAHYSESRNLPEVHPNSRELGGMIMKGGNTLYWSVDQVRKIKDKRLQFIEHKYGRTPIDLTRAGAALAAKMAIAESVYVMTTSRFFQEATGVYEELNLLVPHWTRRDIHGFIKTKYGVQEEFHEVHLRESRTLLQYMGTKMRIASSKDIERAYAFDKTWHPLLITPAKLGFIIGNKQSRPNHKELK